MTEQINLELENAISIKESMRKEGKSDGEIETRLRKLGCSWADIREVFK